MRILIIKMTSMGDLMHALPAISDACAKVRDISIDWVADQYFMEVPSWHHAVNNVIPSATRAWKKAPWQHIKQGDLSAFHRALSEKQYDAVIDLQGNIKSAVIARLAKGERHGYDAQSIREKPAQIAYQKQHRVDKQQHSIERMRQLMAKSLGYTHERLPMNYGVDFSQFGPSQHQPKRRYIVGIHNASWDTKLWPESHWHQLIERANSMGYHVLLPCGNAEELERSQRLAEGKSISNEQKRAPKTEDDNGATALPRLSLSEVASLILNAEGAVSCDTGLAHLCAILGTPTVSFYGPTDQRLIGATGDRQTHLVADEFSCAPCYKKTCEKNPTQPELAACMQAFEPHTVWQALEQQMRSNFGSR